MKKIILLFGIICLSYCNLCSQGLFGRFLNWLVYDRIYDYEEQADRIIFTEHPDCPDNKDWVLVFEDEFNSLNTSSNWVVKNDYWGERCWSSDNVSTSGGILNIEDKQENRCPNCGYSSGLIISRHLYKEGKFEIRCKIPPGQGSWPSFWLYSNPNGEHNEIDVFEFWNEYKWTLNTNTGQFEKTIDRNLINRVVNMTPHFRGNQCGETWIGEDFSQNFHTFSVEWDMYKIVWRIDGIIRRTLHRFITYNGQQGVTCSNLSTNVPYITQDCFPTEAMNIWLNSAVQYEDGYPPLPSELPRTFDIDYVRIYKRINNSKVVNISNLADIDQYNITGKEIYIEGNQAIIQGSQNYRFIAKDKIVLGAGFQVQLGGTAEIFCR